MVSYFAAAAVRDSVGWTATEVSLTDAADIEDVADRLRDVDPAADLSLLFVESDDTYLVVLRLDQGEDLRIFGSDIAFADDSRLGALLLGEIGEPVVELAVAELAAAEVGSLDIDDRGVDSGVDSGGRDSGGRDSGAGDTAAGDIGGDDIGGDDIGGDDNGGGDEPEAVAVLPGADPVGDADLLADLGVPASKLLELCAHDGMLPSDVTAEICQAIGCGDEVEELREA